MLFAACTTATPNPLQLTSHASNNLGQQQLTSLQQLKDRQVTSLSSSSSTSSSSSSSSNMPTPKHMSPQHQAAATGNAVAAAAVAMAASARVNEEAKEAMRKLDATLVAYLAGETKLQPKQLEPKLELELNSPNDPNDVTDEYVLEEFEDTVEKSVENLTREELQLFRCIKSVKLQLEALTLEPEGTKRMELLQNETRPIFTVECQLSHELIQHLPRYEMFHIMQFESEKFHSLTQCTRFGQEAQRDINLTPLIDELDFMNGNNNKTTKAVEMPNFGRIHFTVWWREPGTCLNEMLGMGVFELRDLYDAALLEQCKRITIQRRGVSLANIYLKINLLLCTLADTANNNNNNSNNIIIGGGGGGIGCETSAIKQHHPNGDDKQQQQQQESSTASGDTNTNTTSTSQSAATSNSTSSNTTANLASPGDNNNVDIDTNSNFNAATLKIRLLTGVINACEVRNISLCLNREYHLVCERFWKTEPAASITEGLHKFFYQEQFAIIRDANFLNCCKRNQLKLKIWQRPFREVTSSGGIANSEEGELKLVGVVSLPLKKFFVAFSNDMMANRMVTEKLPVIAIDDWVPIINEAKVKVGEIKCLLAIGSESQINNLKVARDLTPLHTDMFSDACIRPGQNTLYPNIRMPPEDIQHAFNVPGQQTNSIKRTVDLMEMLQQALQQTREAINTSEASNANEAMTVQSAVRLSERTFQFELHIECAASLPQNAIPKGKSGKNATKRSSSKRFPPGEAPTTYVTFQADMCSGSSGLYNSHEGKVYATDVVERNTNPRWAQHFLVTVSSEYLENPHQNFILKLWKKANVPPANGNANDNSSPFTTRLLPKPCDDAILGFTSLDLSVFLRGMHIGGIFNVIDFNGRINGQLYLNAKPLDGWYVRYLAQRISQHPTQTQETLQKSQSPASYDKTTTTIEFLNPRNKNVGCGAIGGDSIENVIEQFENTLDLNLGQAVKQKYNELEGISKRLRARLSDVTGEQLQQQLDLHALENWLPFSDVVVAEQAMDNELNEFERDINTSADVSANVSEYDEHSEVADIANLNFVVVQEGIIGDNESDNKEEMISKTSPGAHDSAVD